MIVDFLRHGTTGRHGHLDGRTDFPLTAEGHAQVSGVTKRKKWDAIVTSPLKRAKEAAEPLARTLAVALRVDADWSEIDFGAWDGRARSEIEADVGAREALAAFYRAEAQGASPGGETRVDFAARIHRAILSLAESPPRQPVLVITHAGPIRQALADVCGLPLDRLWSIRIGHATRVRLEFAIGGDGLPWGEIVEVAQP